MTDLLKITFGNGEFEMVQTATGGSFVNRGGEFWRSLSGDKLALSLGYELEEARLALGSDSHEAPDQNGEDIRVAVDDGKYEIILPASDPATGRITRHGEPWRDIDGEEFIVVLATELAGARALLANPEPGLSAP